MHRNLESEACVDRDRLSVSEQLTKEVRFKAIFIGTNCSRSFDSGRDFIPYLG